MTTQFRLRPDELDRIAADIDAVHAGDYCQAVAALRHVNQAIAGAWIGASSQAFDALHAGWITRLEFIGQDLPRVATFLRAAADEYRRRDGERTAAMFTTHTAQSGRGSAGLPPRAVAPGTYRDAPVAGGPVNQTMLMDHLTRLYGAQAAAQMYRAWQADPAFLAALSALPGGGIIQPIGDINAAVQLQWVDGRWQWRYLDGRPADLGRLQGRGPYLIRDTNGALIADPMSGYNSQNGLLVGPVRNTFMPYQTIWQPVYDYSVNPPRPTNRWREYQVGIGEVSVTVWDAAKAAFSAGGARGAPMTITIAVNEAVRRGLLSSAAGQSMIAVGGPAATIVLTANAINSAGTVSFTYVRSQERTGEFWNGPGVIGTPIQPGQPAPVSVPHPIWPNPNGPNYPGTPGWVSQYGPPPSTTPTPPSTTPTPPR
jgi:WXG100 family type VII secretion target